MLVNLDKFQHCEINWNHQLEGPRVALVKLHKGMDSGRLRHCWRRKMFSPDDDASMLILEEGESSSYRGTHVSLEKLEWDAAMH